MAVPEEIATRYDLSSSEEVNHMYNTVVEDKTEEIYQVGGHQALLLLENDNEMFMPKKIETIEDS